VNTIRQCIIDSHGLGVKAGGFRYQRGKGGTKRIQM